MDRPWRDLPKKDRDWILFTDDQPVVPVYAGLTPAEARRALKRKEEPSYQGTFTSARRHVFHTFAHSDSALMKKRVSRFMLSTDCPLCGGKRLRQESLSVTFMGLDISEMSRLPLARLATLLRPHAEGRNDGLAGLTTRHPDRALAARRITEDVEARLSTLLDLGLGYLTLDRSTPTLSPGELQRLRLATQVRSNLFGVVYVLDEPSAGLHPADTAALLAALDRLKASGNSLFVVEHELEVMRHADWIVDVGPGAGEHGGHVLYSGPPDGLADITESRTRGHLFRSAPPVLRAPRTPAAWLRMTGIVRNNLHGIDVEIPLGVLTTVTGVSGSGKSSLISQALVELVAARLGHELALDEDETEELERTRPDATAGRIAGELPGVRRLVRVDQRPIGRTPRSNLATYTGLFDHVRTLFASTRMARARKYDAGRFSFNVRKGRCETCAGEGLVMVELLFLPSVYAPCPACHGARYNPRTLEVRYREKTIADVLGMTVDTALAFFTDEPALRRALSVVREVGLGYLRLGQSATELSGGEAQRIKLATELQRMERGTTLYVLDEPTTGLHPEDVDRLVAQLQGLVESGNTVVVVEHDMSVIAASDYVIDVGPGAGEEGGRVVASGSPADIARHPESRTAPYLARFMSHV